jgi:integrase
MQGHIYRRRKPDGTWSRWHAVIDLPVGSTGRRRQKTSTHDTKRDAQAWLAKVTQELRAGELYDTKLTVAEYLTGWLQGRQSLRPSTRQAYETHLVQHVLPELGHLRLLDLRSHHIEEMYRQITDANPRRERPIGPTTMRRIHATLNSALNTAVRRGLIRRNPATTVDLPHPSPVTPRAWTSEEVAAFLTATRDDHLAVLYRLLVLTGLRRGEAVGLRWSDLDLTTGKLTVNRQVVSVDGELIIGPPKSDAGRRTVALDQGTVELLRLRHRRDRIAHWSSTDEDFDNTPVFRRSDGKGVHPAYVSRHFTTLVTRHGLPPIRLHDLRHTSASIGLAGGETLLEVSRRLGHSSITVTADIYSHVSAATAAESAERLANLIDDAI